ncbi:hypothetical protein NRA15_17795 [Acinetobacter baumannii]|nr:hypothetical protein [Acinetobacter baumannii]
MPPTWAVTDLKTTFRRLQPTTPYYIRVAAYDVGENMVWNYTKQIKQNTCEA